MKRYICEFDGKELGIVEAENEEQAYEKMTEEYPNYNYGLYDGVAEVYELEEDDPLSRTHLEKYAIKRANEIIKEKGLNFYEFFNTTNLYEYNAYIANSRDYRKLELAEYRILVAVIILRCKGVEKVL